MAFVIVDLIQCCFRIIFASFSTLALFVPTKLSAELSRTILPEAISSWGIAVFGIPANALILAKKPVGVSLGWINVVFFAFNMLTTVWQLSIQVGAITNSAEQMGAIAGGGIMVAVRLILAACYCVALIQARKTLS